MSGVGTEVSELSFRPGQECHRRNPASCILEGTAYNCSLDGIPLIGIGPWDRCAILSESPISRR